VLSETGSHFRWGALDGRLLARSEVFSFRLSSLRVFRRVAGGSIIHR
jgi:hypothetical protein